MTSWTCLRCSTCNPGAQRFCAKCNARVSPLHENIADDPGPAESWSTHMTTPGVGEMTAGLDRLVGDFHQGILSAGQLVTRLRTAAANVPAVFAEIHQGVQAVPTDEATCKDFVHTRLDDAERLLLMGLDEMASFEAREDSWRLRVGRLIVGKAEEEYIRLVRELQETATGYPFRGQPNVVAHLAGEVTAGTMTLETFRLRLAELGQATEGRLEEIRRLVHESITEATTFDGTSREGLDRAVEMLARPVDLLGEAMLNLYDPTEVERAASHALAAATCTW